MDFLTEPWQHQLDIFNKHKDKDYLALFMPMGTGKTRVVIDFIRYKSYLLHRPCKTLVVTPNITLENWLNEINKFSRLKGIVLQGTKDKRLKNLQETDYNIKIINYEGLQSIKDALLKESWDCLVCDESQRIKGFKNIRTKICIALSRKIPYRYILSGTPVLNNPLDIFSQYLVLDKGETFGASYYGFRNKYFEDKNTQRKGTNFYYPNYTAKPDIISLLNKLIMEKAETRKKEDCLDLPPKVFQVIKIDMLPEQKKMYNEMKNLLISYFKDQIVTASSAVVKLIRLNQIASGYFSSEEGLETSFNTNPKIEALKSILEDLCIEHKVIIWAVFRNNIKSLRKELKNYNPAILYGDTKDKQAEIDKFCKTKDCRILIANPQSAGLGINLVEADYAIYFSYNFSLEQRLQSMERNHRGGSEIHEKITYIDIVARDTIDEYILKTLVNKEDIAKNIISQINCILE